MVSIEALSLKVCIYLVLKFDFKLDVNPNYSNIF